MTVGPDVSAAADHLAERLGMRPRVGIILGSGLGTVVERADEIAAVPFDELPGFPRTGVAGHAGRYVAGRIGDTDVLFQCGRFHYYEGHVGDIVAAPVRVAAALGVRTLILTNAAGAVREDLRPGAVVLIQDHLNLMFRSPLVGGKRETEVRFPDMTHAYDRGLRQLAVEAAREAGVQLAHGVYAAVTGPSYETPAEVRALASLGADLVGMSTVPEVLVARALGLRCLGVSVVTNKAAGLGEGTLSHEEVIDTGRVAAEGVADLLTGLVAKLDDDYSGSAA